VTDDELLRARDVLAQRQATTGLPRGAPPDGVVLCYQAGPISGAITRWRTRRLHGFHADLRALRRTGGRVAVATRFGVGAPAAVALLEELVAFGVRRFVSIGLAGGLAADQRAGDLLVAARALRAEGTSLHYLPPGDAVDASPPLTRRLAAALTGAGRRYVMGTTCTTDAPYRTSRAAVERWTQAGAAAVEMEAAGIFAAAALRGVEAAAACVLADTLEPGGWRLAFDQGVVTPALRALFQAAVASLT
jgi:uridine phosphorylase